MIKINKTKKNDRHYCFNTIFCKVKTICLAKFNLKRIEYRHWISLKNTNVEIKCLVNGKFSDPKLNVNFRVFDFVMTKIIQIEEYFK